MKKRGLMLFISLLLIIGSCSVMAACTETVGNQDNLEQVYPISINEISNPYLSGSYTFKDQPIEIPGEGVEPKDTDFDLSRISYKVIYSNGTSKRFDLTKEMLSDKTKKDLNNLNDETTKLLIEFFPPQLKSSESKKTILWIRKRQKGELYKTTIVLNGGSVSGKKISDDIYKIDISKNTVINSYESFLNALVQNGHTIKNGTDKKIDGVVILDKFDFKTNINETYKPNKKYTGDVLTKDNWDTNYKKFQLNKDKIVLLLWDLDNINVYYHNFNFITEKFDGYEMVAQNSNKSFTLKYLDDSNVIGWSHRSDDWYYSPKFDENEKASINIKAGKDDIHLYPKWTKDQYTINFNLVGGEIKDQSINFDDNNNFSENGKVVGEKRLENGDFVGLKYNALTFDSNLSSFSLLKSNIEINELLFKNEYVEFGGWYIDSSYDIPFDITNVEFEANKEVINEKAIKFSNRQLNLYAKWNKAQTCSVEDYNAKYLYANNFKLNANDTITIKGINDKTISTLTIPNSLTIEKDGIKYTKRISKIENNAFENCKNLRTVIFEGENENVNLGSYVFKNCKLLESIVNIDGNEPEWKFVNVGENSFTITKWFKTKQKAKQDVILSNALIKNFADDLNANPNLDKITVYAEKCFEDNKFVSFEIGANVEYICDQAFEGCENLAAITIPEDNKLKFVATSAFADTSWLSSKENKIKKLGKVLYRVIDTEITAFEIPSDIEYISEYAFNGLKNIETITLADSCNLKTINKYAFLTTAWYKNNTGFLILNGMLLSYNGELTSIQTPENVTKIASYAIGNKVTSIILNENVNSIMSYAFADASNLQFANYAGMVSLPDISLNTFSNRNNDICGSEEFTFSLVASNKNSESSDDETNKTLYDYAISGQIGGIENEIAMHYKTINETHKFNFNEDFVTEIKIDSIEVENEIIVERDYKINNENSKIQFRNALENEICNTRYKIHYKNGTATDFINFQTKNIKNLGSLEAPDMTFTLNDQCVDHKIVLEVNGFQLGAKIDPDSTDETKYYSYKVHPKIANLELTNSLDENDVALTYRTKYFAPDSLNGNVEEFDCSNIRIVVNYASAIKDEIPKGVISIPRFIDLDDENCGVDKLVTYSGFNNTVVRDSGTVTFEYHNEICTMEYSVANPSIEEIKIKFNEENKNDADSVINDAPIRVEQRNGKTVLVAYICKTIQLNNFNIEIVRDDYIAKNVNFSDTFAMSNFGITFEGKVLDANHIIQPTTEGQYDIHITYNRKKINDKIIKLIVLLKNEQSVYDFEINDGKAYINGLADYDNYPNVLAIPNVIKKAKKEVADNGETGIVIEEYPVVEIRDANIDEDNSAFKNLYNVSRICLPNSLKIIGSNAFLNNKFSTLQFYKTIDSGNDNLANLNQICTTADNVLLNQIKTSAFAGSNIEKLDLRNTNIIEIADSAFYECKKLKKVFLPNNLETIGNCAFYGCDVLGVDDDTTDGIENGVVVPASVKTIGKLAFATCKNLKILVIKGNNVQLCERALGGVDNKSFRKIYINFNEYFESNNSLKSGTNYENCTTWKSYAYEVDFENNPIVENGNKVLVVGYDGNTYLRNNPNNLVFYAE